MRSTTKAPTSLGQMAVQLERVAARARHHLDSPLAGRDDGAHGPRPVRAVHHLTDEVGASVYERIDAPATFEEKEALLSLSPDDVTATHLAGDVIEARLTTAPGNGAPIGGVKVITAHGGLAARPSGTEAVYKLYAESFRGSAHLQRIQEEARALISRALTGVIR